MPKSVLAHDRNDCKSRCPGMTGDGFGLEEVNVYGGSMTGRVGESAAPAVWMAKKSTVAGPVYGFSGSVPYLWSWQSTATVIVVGTGGPPVRYGVVGALEQINLAVTRRVPPPVLCQCLMQFRKWEPGVRAQPPRRIPLVAALSLFQRGTLTYFVPHPKKDVRIERKQPGCTCSRFGDREHTSPGWDSIRLIVYHVCS